MLWEIGVDGCDVRILRVRLDLDFGYLSRLLRSLTSVGLVEVEPSVVDVWVRMARLTGKGLDERRVFDERSDELVALIFEPLDDW